MTLRQRLFGTLRRQLTLGVALVIGVLMSALVLDLTLRQRETLLARRAAATTGLAQVLAISAAGGLAGSPRHRRSAGAGRCRTPVSAASLRDAAGPPGPGAGAQ